MSSVIGTMEAYLRLNISDFETNLQRAREQVASVSAGFDTLTAVGDKIAGVGTKLTTGLTLPIVGIGTAAVKTTADFDATMSKVSAISGATGSDLDALRAKAKEMGESTKFSATESAQAFTYMSMAGWKTGDMLDGISGIMNLAAADGLDLATTSDIVTDALTAFGLTASDSGHFADVLATASSNANTNVSMLGESFKYVAPVAGAMGYSVEDVSKALGLMANAGIKGSQSGTALRTMMTNMVKPTDAAQVAMDKYGLSLTNADGTMKSYGEVMDMLRTQLGGLDEATQAQVATTIFGKEAMSGALAIINASEQDYKKLGDAIAGADGTAQRMADTMNDNLLGQLTLLKSQLESVAIQIGEILVPILRKMLTHVSTWIEKFSELFKSHGELIITIAAVVAAIGPLLIGIGKVISAIGTMGSTLSNLKTMMTAAGGASKVFTTVLSGITGPVLAVVAAIGVLVAAFKHLWDTNEEFRTAITNIWNGIVEKFQSFTQGIVDRLNSLGFEFSDITDVLKTIWEEFCNFLAPAFEGTFQMISDILGTALDVLTGLFDVFAGLFTGDWDMMWTGVKEVFSGIWEGIQNLLSTYLEMLKNTADVVLGWFGTNWDEVWTSIKTFFIDTWNSISTFWTDIFNTIQTTAVTIWTAISTFFTIALNNIREFFTSIWNGISNFFTNTWNNISTFFTNTVNSIQQTAITVWTSISNFFTLILTNIKSTVSTVWESIKTNISTVVNAIKTIVQSWLNTLWEIIKNIFYVIVVEIDATWQNIKNIITTAITTIKDTLTTIWNAIKDMITTVITNIKTIITNVFEAIREFLNGNTEAAKQHLITAWLAIKNTINSIVNTVKTIITTVFEAIKTNVTTIINAVYNFISTTFQAIKGAIVNITNAISSHISTTFTTIKSTVTSITTNVKETLTNLWTNIKTNVSNLVDSLKTGVTNGFNNMKDRISLVSDITKSTLSTTWENIKSDVSSKVDSLKQNASNSFNNMKDRISMTMDIARSSAVSLAEKMRSEMSTKWDNLKSNTSSAFDNIKSTMSNKLSEAKSSVTSKCSEILNGMKNVFSNIHSIFSGIGRNVIEGIKSGISGAVSGLYSSIKSALSGLVDRAKSALGIHSPSRVFADSIGKFIPSGIAAGIEENESSAQKAISEMADQLVNQANELDGMTINSSLATSLSSLPFETIQDNLIRLVQSLMSTMTLNSYPLAFAGMGNLTSKQISTNGATNTDLGNTIIIEQIVVRDDNDLNTITRGLYDKNDRSLRALGRRTK